MMSREVVEVLVTYEDGSTVRLSGKGTLHLANTERKTDIMGVNDPVRQANVHIAVTAEVYNGPR